MTTLQKILTGLLLFACASCSTGYDNEGNSVYYKSWNEAVGSRKEKIVANPKTFKVLKFDKYAKDDKKVFYEGQIVEGADAQTFEAIYDFYAKDKNNGYYGKDIIKKSNGKTFKVINGDYSTDGMDYFYITEPLNMADPKNFRIVYKEGNLYCWTTDGKYYYFNNYKVPSDDYENLTIYEKSGGISKDKHWVYFCDHKLNYDTDGNKVVDTIDVASFNVTKYFDCRDKYGCINVFHGRTKCKE